MQHERPGEKERGIWGGGGKRDSRRDKSSNSLFLLTQSRSKREDEGKSEKKFTAQVVTERICAGKILAGKAFLSCLSVSPLSCSFSISSSLCCCTTLWTFMVAFPLFLWRGFVRNCERSFVLSSCKNRSLGNKVVGFSQLIAIFLEEMCSREM